MFDFKYDGFRGLCYLEPGRCRFISRNGNVLRRFGALGDKVAAVLDVDEALIDGEMIAGDATGRPVFIDRLERKSQTAPFSHVGMRLYPWKAHCGRLPSAPMIPTFARRAAARGSSPTG